MKYLLTGIGTAALLSLAAPAGAQMYTPGWAPGPMYAPAGPPQSSMMNPSALPPEMRDDGSSSDFPTHTASDFGADRLNRQVMIQNGDEEPAAGAYRPY